MRSDNTYLEHILEAINAIEGYLGDSRYEEFKNNKLVIDGVVRELEIIGEASSNLSEKFKRDNSEMPYREAIDMRNFLIHEYFGVNTQIVWETCKKNLPELKKFIEAYLK